MKGICQECGEIIDNKLDSLCYDDTGHIRAVYGMYGCLKPESCGPIKWVADWIGSWS